MDETLSDSQDGVEIEKFALKRARQRAYTARWNLDIAVFAFAVLIVVVILLFIDVRLEIVAPVAIVGLALVWLAGWWHGRKLLSVFYDEEIEVLQSSVEKIEKKIEKKLEDESIEEIIQRALKDRRQ